MEESLAGSIEELLKDLKQSSVAYDRQRAAEELEKLPDSNEDIVRALVIAETSDPDRDVREAAAQALLGAAHVAIIQSNRDLAQWKKATEQTAQQRIANKESKASQRWFERHWYLLFFPVFLCSAGAQFTTTLPSIIVGIIFSVIIVRIAADFDRAWKKGIFIAFTPVITLVVATLLAMVSSYNWPFEWSDINNPYLTMEQRVWRAVIDGVGGIVTTLVTVSVVWSFKSFIRDKRVK